MKIIRLIAIAALLAVVLSVNLFSEVSALSQSGIEVLTFKSEEVKVPGETFGMNIIITNTASQQLTINAVGVHFDWMEKDELYGPNYASDPIELAAGKDFTIRSLNFTIPFGTASGNHTYYVGIDGYEADGTPFSWTSTTEETISIAGSSSTSTPTPTGNQQGQTTDYSWIIYVAVIAAVVVIAVLLVIMKKRGSTVNKQETPKTAQKPDENQDFNI